MKDEPAFMGIRALCCALACASCGGAASGGKASDGSGGVASGNGGASTGGAVGAFGGSSPGLGGSSSGSGGESSKGESFPAGAVFQACRAESGDAIDVRVVTTSGCISIELGRDRPVADCIPIATGGAWCVTRAEYSHNPEECEGGVASLGTAGNFSVKDDGSLDLAIAFLWADAPTEPGAVGVQGCVPDCSGRDCRQ